MCLVALQFCSGIFFHTIFFLRIIRLKWTVYSPSKRDPLACKGNQVLVWKRFSIEDWSYCKQHWLQGSGDEEALAGATAKTHGSRGFPQFVDKTPRPGDDWRWSGDFRIHIVQSWEIDPIGSMVCLPTFTIRNQLNVGIYTIHGWNGDWKLNKVNRSNKWIVQEIHWWIDVVIYVYTKHLNNQLYWQT